MSKFALTPAERLKKLIARNKREALERTLAHQLATLQLTIPLHTEYTFHPSRKWRFDFALPDLRIAIEVEGGTYKESRHTSGKGYHEDCNKYNAAALLGWRVLRYDSTHVLKGDAYRELAILLKDYSGCAIVDVGGES